MVASRQVQIPFYSAIGQHAGRGFGVLAQVIGKTAVPFGVNVSSQLQSLWVLTWWMLLCQKLQRLLVVKNFSRQLHRMRDDKISENIWQVLGGSGRQTKTCSRQAESFQQNLENKTETF